MKQFSLILQPGNLPIEELEIDFPEDGSPAMATARVAGDATLHSEATGITLTAGNVTWGPFRGLGDWEYNPSQKQTTLHLAESAEIKVLARENGTVLDILQATWPGIDTSEVPELILGTTSKKTEPVVKVGSLIIRNGQPVLAQAGDPETQPEPVQARQWFNSTLGGLGFRLIRDNQGAYHVVAPATDDRVFNGVFDEENVPLSRQRSNIPSRVTINGPRVSVTAQPFGSMFKPASSVQQDANQGSREVSLNWTINDAPDNAALWGFRIMMKGSQVGTLQAQPGQTSFSYTAKNVSEGVNTFDIYTIYRVANGSGTTLVDALHPVRETVLINVAFDPATVKFDFDFDGVLVRMPTGSPAVKIDALGSTITTSQSFGIGPGMEISGNLAQGQTYTVYFSDPNTGVVLGNRNFSLPIPSVKNLQVSPQAQSADVSWQTPGPGGTYRVRVYQNGKVIGGDDVQGTSYTASNLLPVTNYTVSVAPVIPNPQVVTLPFKTLAMPPVDLSDEERFEQSSDGTYTTTSTNETVNKVNGNTFTTTTTVVNTKVKRRKALVTETTQTTATSIMSPLDQTGQHRTQQVQTFTETVADYQYEIGTHPTVMTGSFTLTTASAPGTRTETREKKSLKWHPRGWLSVELSDKSETIYAVSPQGQLTVASIVNERTSQNWTRIRNGVWAWSTKTETTTRVQVPRYNENGQAVDSDWDEAVVVATDRKCPAPPPDMVSQEDGGAGLEMGQEPAAPADPNTGQPTAPTDPTPTDPVGSDPNTGTPPPAFEPSVSDNPEDQTIQRLIFSTREAGGFADPLVVNAEWLHDQPRLDFAADFVAARFGRPALTATRTYLEPVGARRGGAVLGVQVRARGQGEVLYEEEVTTRWAPQT